MLFERVKSRWLGSWAAWVDVDNGPVMWRSMGLLYLAAAALTFGTLELGLHPGAREAEIAALAAISLLAGALLVAFAKRLPEFFKLPVLYSGLVLATAVVVASGQAVTPYLLFYVWIGVDTWFFLKGRQAVVLTTATLVASAAVTGYMADTGAAAAWWLMVVGSLVALSALVGVLHARSQRLIERFANASIRDSLTGLLNRRGYQQRLASELASARRYETSLSILLGDLDRFKSLNDRYGHRIGDDALRRFAELCHQELRGGDFVSRVDGEEFAIVLPNTDAHGAILAGERLRRVVRAELRSPDGAPITAFLRNRFVSRTRLRRRSAARPRRSGDVRRQGDGQRPDRRVLARSAGPPRGVGCSRALRSGPAARRDARPARRRNRRAF